jgi:hypothetical protein
MKKNLCIGLTLAKILVLSSAITMLTLPVEASTQQGGSGLTKYPNYEQFEDTRMGPGNMVMDVFTYLLTFQGPHDRYIVGDIYTLPEVAQEITSPQLSDSIAIVGQQFLEENHDSIRLNIKPSSDSKGAILDFQIGNKSYASVVLAPHNTSRSFSVVQIMEALNESLRTATQITLTAQ